MIAYEGKDPYVFVSYSHKDADRVIPIIRALKDRMCRVWFDEGLTPGESWNDSIAEHLLKCTAFVVFLSPDSVASKYVFAEINYAVSKDKKIIPVMLEQTSVPLGLDMMLSSLQMADLRKTYSPHECAATLLSVLPSSVIALTQMPFLTDLGYTFHLECQEVERQETGIKNACTVFCENEQGERIEIFGLKRTGAYETSYCISSVEKLKDYYYSGSIKGAYQVNLKGSFLLEYPLYGPDVDVLLICILRIPRHGVPTMRLVDYQYVDSVSSLNLQDEEDFDVVGRKGWSTQIQNYLEGRLYQ